MAEYEIEAIEIWRKSVKVGQEILLEDTVKEVRHIEKIWESYSEITLTSGRTFIMRKHNTLLKQKKIKRIDFQGIRLSINGVVQRMRRYRQW